jgi:hypothetical protein
MLVPRILVYPEWMREPRTTRVFIQLLIAAGMIFWYNGFTLFGLRKDVYKVVIFILQQAKNLSLIPIRLSVLVTPLRFFCFHGF